MIKYKHHCPEVKQGSRILSHQHPLVRMSHKIWGISKGKGSKKEENPIQSLYKADAMRKVSISEGDRSHEGQRERSSGKRTHRPHSPAHAAL